MYLMFTLVLGLILFILVYGKYVRVVGAVSRRTKQFEAFARKMEQRIQGLQETNAHLRAEISLTKKEIERQEQRLAEASGVSQAGGESADEAPKEGADQDGGDKNGEAS